MYSSYEQYDKIKYSAFEKMSYGKSSKMTSREKKVYLSHADEYTSWFVKQLHIQDKIDSGYNYLLTFTINPKKYDPTSKHDLKYIKDYIKKQLLRSPLKINKAYLVEEGTLLPKKKDDKQKHFHAAVNSSISLTKNLFNYYIKTIGNIDFSTTKVNNLLESLNYTSKDFAPDRVV